MSIRIPLKKYNLFPSMSIWGAPIKDYWIIKIASDLFWAIFQKIFDIKKERADWEQKDLVSKITWLFIRFVTKFILYIILKGLYG